MYHQTFYWFFRLTSITFLNEMLCLDTQKKKKKKKKKTFEALLLYIYIYMKLRGINSISGKTLIFYLSLF